MTKLQRLYNEQGQSPWLDNLTRVYLRDGTLRRLHHALFVQAREQVGKEASPTAAIVDSQSVKSAEKGGRALIRQVTTRVKRSRARSATSWSTRWASF